MQFTALFLFATTALAAVTPLTKCQKDFAKCQQSAGALSLLSTCSIDLAACNAVGTGKIVDDADADDNNDKVLSPATKKAFRKCKKQFNTCKRIDGVKLRTCAKQARECYADVEVVEIPRSQAGQGLSINL